MADKLLNLAGATQADPILKGLGFSWIISPDSFDVATVTSVDIDPATGFPPAGGNSVLGSLTPSAGTIIKGTTGSYTHIGTLYTIGVTTGLTAGDYIFLSHAGLPDGIYEIASVVDATDITLVSNPLSADQTNISFQVAWKYDGIAGTAPSLSNAAGDENFYKSDLTDGASNTQTEDKNFIRDAPAGSAYINLGGGSYTGQTIGANQITLQSILSGWVNNGGVSHVALSGTGAFWNVGLTDQTEKTLAAAETATLYLTAGDTTKNFNILLRSATGGLDVTVACDVTVDTTGPTVTHSIIGR